MVTGPAIHGVEPGTWLPVMTSQSGYLPGVACFAAAADQATPRRAEASMPYQATSATTFPAANPSHTPPGSGLSSHAAPARPRGG